VALGAGTAVEMAAAGTVAVLVWGTEKAAARVARVVMAATELMAAERAGMVAMVALEVEQVAAEAAEVIREGMVVPVAGTVAAAGVVRAERSTEAGRRTARRIGSCGLCLSPALQASMQSCLSP